MPIFRHRAKEHGAKEDLAADLSYRLITIQEPASAASEAYRTLRTNLMYALVDNPPRTIMLTSPEPREGKSTTCANLAVVLSQTGKTVLLLDCDLRKPVMHKIFGLRNLKGLVDVLAGETKLQEVQKEYLTGLNVVTTGPMPSNPTEMLGSERFAQLLATACQRFDYVLIDAPPVAPVSDSVVLATKADGVLLVFDAQNTRKVSLRRSARDIEAVGGRLLGTTMNNMKSRRDNYYGYHGYAYDAGQ